MLPLCQFLLLALLAFLFGVALGLTTALTIVWGVLTPEPTQIVADPSGLTTESKETYMLLVSMSYLADGDLERAKQRLVLLNDLDLQNTLAHLAERYILELRPEPQRRALARHQVPSKVGRRQRSAGRAGCEIVHN